MEITFGSILLRVSIIYLYVLALVRISGKQSIGQLSAMDFAVATIIGDQFDSVIFSEVPIVQGLVGFGTIVFLHMLVTYASSKSTFLHHLFSPPPRMILQNGNVLREGLGQEWMNMDTLQSEMRLKGEDQLQEVKEARLESQGQLSILKNESSKPVTKKDLRLFG